MKTSNPFPGMNPFLEGNLWRDVHQSISIKIRNKIVPLIRPKYIAIVEQYVEKDHIENLELKVMYPDVAVFKNKVKESSIIYGDNHPPITPANISIVRGENVKIKIPVIEIRERDGNNLVTVIEVLSPVNKRKPGINKYAEKRQNLFNSKVHLIEIDLLRRGTRLITHPEAEKADYLVALSRGNIQKTDIWTIDVQDKLPTIPVPLGKDDDDIPLNLQMAMEEIFEEAGYQDALNYSKLPPVPKFSLEKMNWIKDRLKNQ